MSSNLPLHSRFYGLQCLRTLAVFLVIWTHLKYTGNFTDNPLIQNSIGAIGVDVFFVISGFVISLSAKSLKFNAKQFFINRITRVAPLYWLTAIPIIAVALLKGNSNWQAIVSTFTFLPLFDFYEYTAPINNFGWTLAYEFWFYASSAIVMSLFADRVWKMSALILVFGALVIHFFYNGAYILPNFIFGLLFLEFFFGILIFRYMHVFGKKSILLFGFGAILTFYNLCLSVDFGDYMLDTMGGLRRAIYAGGFGACLVITAVAAELNGFKRWPKWAIYLGECSYSIYILQHYALWLAANTSRIFGLSAWASGSVFIFSSITLGVVSSIYIERPLTRGVRNIFNRKLTAKSQVDRIRSEPAPEKSIS